MRNQNRKIDGPRPALAQESNIADLEVEEQIAGQEQGRCRHGGNHAGAMSRHFSPRYQDAAGEQQGRTGAIQGCVQSGEESVLLGDHAAGLVVRRLTIRNANPNMNTENRTSVAIADGIAKFVSAPGYNKARRADTP